MISKFKESPQKTKQKQLNTCLFQPDKPKSSITTTTITTSLDSNRTIKPKMSSLTADLRAAAAATAATAAKTSTLKPPMEAVVINSIIYSKPSFCGIVVDLGGSVVGEVSTTKEKMPNGTCPNKIFGNEGFNLCCPMGIKPSPLGFASACLAGFTSPPPPPPPSSMAAQQDAQVYRMCTTMNGSIHHQISDLCDNLLAMASYFGVTNDDHDDDSFIEFAYNDGEYEDDMDEDDDEEDDDEEDETDDEDDIDVEYDNDDEDEYLDVDKGIVDFSYECSTINAPKFNCDKKKKVRFNTKPIVHVMHTWSYAYRAARKGQWEMYARDRERFRLRVQRAAVLLNPILEREHRQKIYEKRFANQLNSNDDDDENQQKLIKQQNFKNEVKIKSVIEAEKFENKTSNNSNQKKKRKRKKRFCKMGNKHYF